MIKNDLRILFMGTSNFSKTILEGMISAGFNVVGIFCAPDKKSGRNNKINICETKELAQKNNISVYQPSNLRDEEKCLEILNEIKPNIFVVASYGKIIPKYILDYPKYSAINVHPSILPNYRGCSPIQTAIIEGEKETGVTLIYMDEHMDTGNIIDCEKVEIKQNENYGSLHDRLAIISSELLIKNLEKLIICPNCVLDSLKQCAECKVVAKMFNRENTKIDFNKTSKEVVDFVRGLSPAPSAWCRLDDCRVYKIYDTVEYELEEIQNDYEYKIGEIVYLNDKKNLFVVKVLNGYINILTLQAPGKKIMSAAEYIRGRKVKTGEIFI